MSEPLQEFTRFTWRM